MVEWLPQETTANSILANLRQKSSNGTKTNWHRKCWCCMTMPGPIPAVIQQRQWYVSLSVHYHSCHIHQTLPHQIMPFHRMNDHCMAAHSLTLVCRAVSTSQGTISRKTSLLQPSASYQIDGNGELTSLGSM
jgi:hypothetical protein